MKKSALTVLAAIFALSLSSCGTSAADEQTSAETVQTTLAETAAKITEAETETTTTTAETTSETTTETETETEPVECHCPTEWQHAYSEYMNELTVIAGGVYFSDINGDEIPEAVISKWTSDKDTIILYYNDNGMGELHLEPNPNWAYVDYIPDTMQILFCPFYGHTTGTWGYEEYYLFSWNGSDYEETSTIYRESGIYGICDGIEYEELGQAYIDGKEVDNDTFEVKLAEFEKLRDENNYFPIVKPDDENFESYMKENFPCFDNWDIVYYKE